MVEFDHPHLTKFVVRGVRERVFDALTIVESKLKTIDSQFELLDSKANTPK